MEALGEGAVAWWLPRLSVALQRGSARMVAAVTTGASREGTRVGWDDAGVPGGMHRSDILALRMALFSYTETRRRPRQDNKSQVRPRIGTAACVYLQARHCKARPRRLVLLTMLVSNQNVTMYQQ